MLLEDSISDLTKLLKSRANLIILKDYSNRRFKAERHMFYYLFDMWILNIDDDVDDRTVFCDAITDINPKIECIAKESAEAAISLLERTSNLPSFIFLDINMPKMGGLECLKLIKQNQRLAAIPVIVLSTTRNPREIEEIKKLGAEFLSKVGTYDKYVSLLKNVLVN
jgi:CheY-like chemotaxis protein